jgi:hypothetical protein
MPNAAGSSKSGSDTAEGLPQLLTFIAHIIEKYLMRMSGLTRIVIMMLIPVCFFFSACRKNTVTINSPVIDTTKYILPLSVGNSWQTVRYTYIGDKIVTGLTDSARTSIIADMMVSVSGEQYMASVEAGYYPVESNSPQDLKWLYWNGKDGLYMLGGFSSSDTLIKKVFLLKYPASPGDTWTVPHIVFDSYLNKFVIKDSTNYDCVATNQELSVPCGTFSCYVYHFRMKPASDVVEEWDYYQYHAPQIGLIGTIVKSSIDSTTKFKILLYKYNVQ